MAWKKSSPTAVQRFDEIAAVDGAKRGLLFGCPIYVLEGERYATLYQDRVVLPGKISKNPRLLREWVRRAVAYARSG